MGENKIENLFEFALNNNELSEFIFGQGKYFVLDREIGNHWPLGSYNQFLIPYLKSNSNMLPTYVWSSLIEEIEKQGDKNLFIDYLIGYLIAYYYPVDSEILTNRTLGTPSNFVDKIRDFISTNKNQLVNDKRGTGVEWNSNNGLYESLKANLEVIKKRGGPDFLPND